MPERLNRALVSESWRLQFSEASVFHLPRVFLDHNPILIDVYCCSQQRSPKTFRFEAVWTMHAMFKSLLPNNWVPSRSIAVSLAAFMDIVQY